MSSSPAVPERVAPLFDTPPFWMAVVLAVMLALHRASPCGTWLAESWRWVGWLPLATAVPMMLHSMWRFVSVGTGLRPFRPATTLVATGAYRWTRNPMYLGMVACQFGVALLLGTVSPMLGPVLMFLLLDRRFVRREEVFLRAAFGEAYEQYCRQVRRWL